MNKIKQSTLIIWIIIIIALISLIFSSSSSLCNSISNDKKNIIIVKKSGGFLFSPSNITIISRKNNLLGIFNQSKYETKISNDGKNILNSNIEITWINNSNAKIILYGEEQDPEEIKVNFDKEINYSH